MTNVSSLARAKPALSVQRKNLRYELRLSQEQAAELRRLRYLLGVAAKRDGVRRPRSVAECVMTAVKTLNHQIAVHIGEDGK